MIQGARALVYERTIDPREWHICSNGGDMHICNVPVLCGITIRSIGDNVYIDGEAIERKKEFICSSCIEIAETQPPLSEEAEEWRTEKSREK